MADSVSTQHSIQDWQRIYDKLTKPELREEVARELAKQKRIEEKKRDTGLNG